MNLATTTNPAKGRMMGVALDRLQEQANLAGIAGEVVKASQGYFLVSKGQPAQAWQRLWQLEQLEEPWFLGYGKNEASQRLAYLSQQVEAQYYDHLAWERYGERDRYPDETENDYWIEQQSWEDWWAGL